MIYTKHRAVKSLKPNSEWSWGSYDYKDLQWHSSDTPPTEAQIDAEFNRLNNAEPMRVLRIERNNRLAASDWTQTRDLTLSNDYAWKTYRQNLRDLPASASPKLDADGNLDMSSVTFPTEPS